MSVASVTPATKPADPIAAGGRSSELRNFVAAGAKNAERKTAVAKNESDGKDKGSLVPFVGQPLFAELKKVSSTTKEKVQRFLKKLHCSNLYNVVISGGDDVDILKHFEKKEVSSDGRDRRRGSGRGRAGYRRGQARGHEQARADGRSFSRIQDIRTTLDEVKQRAAAGSASRDAASRDAASRDAASRDAASRDTSASSTASSLRVLDVGCSEGRITETLGAYLELPKEDIVGTDVRDVLSSASFTFVKPVSEVSLPFGDASFDLVVMFQSAHHFSDPAKMFAEARRVLKPGGVLVLREHDTSDPEMRVFLDFVHALYEMREGESTARQFASNYLKSRFANYRPIAEWEKLCRAAGFTLFEVVRPVAADLFESKYLIAR